MSVSSLNNNVDLLVALDSINPTGSEAEGALVKEAKERGLLVSFPSKQEFRPISLTNEELRRILSLITRLDHKSYMELRAAVLSEGEKRLGSR